MKKILATILALVLAIGVATMAWATETAAEKVAKVGETEYATLQEAVNAADGKTVQLLQDVTASITIESGKTVTLDLNGKTLTNEDGQHTITNNGTLTNEDGQHTITNNGTLTIVDTSAAKSGTVDNVTHAKGAIVNYGVTVLNGGTFERSQEKGTYSPYGNGGNSWYTIANYGKMEINAGVTVYNNGGYSSMIRNVGEGPDASTLTINGGTFSGGINTVKNDEAGVLVINGGNFSNTAQYVIMNWHKTTINNGTFETLESAEAVLFTSNWGGDAGAATSAGELTITGGTFKRATNTQKMIVDAYDANNTGTASISGGTFDADVSQYLESGKQQNADGSVGNIPRYYYNSTTTTDTKKDDNKGTSPKTFDAGVGIYAVTAVLSVTGMAWTAKKRH